MATMKAWTMFTSLAVLLLVCASVTAQDELNTNCTLTPVITDQLKTKLFEYFDKSSETKLLEYKLVFDNYTNNQKCKDSATWRWFRAQEFGSVYFFFFNEDFWANRIKFKSISDSVEIKFQTIPAKCLGNLTCREQQSLIRNALISDFNLKKELQQNDIELSKNVEICLNENKNDMFEHYRCCGFNRWNEYYCNDQSVNFKIVYFCVPFIISICIMLCVIYKLWLSYRTVKFGIYPEANTVINEWKKIQSRPGESVHGYKTVLASKFMTMEGSAWLLFDYYIHKLFFFCAGYSAEHISFYMPRLKHLATSDPKMQQKLCWKLSFFSNVDSPLFVTLLLERFLLTLPFVELVVESLLEKDYARAAIFFIVSTIICLMLDRFCFKQNAECSFHIFTQNKIKQCIIIFIISIYAVVFYFSIFWYVKLIFKLIAIAFVEFEKADVIISIALVVVIYLHGVFETTNSQLIMCLRDFKVALDDVVCTKGDERTKYFTFLLECEGSSEDNQGHKPVTSDMCDISLHATTDRSRLVVSSGGSDEPESITNISVSNKLPLFYDTDGNLYVWKELFYNCCRQFFGRRPQSCLNKIVMATKCCILSCYLLMLGMLVWYFEDFYDYSFLKTVFIIIAGGMLPKVLGMVFGARPKDVSLQNTDNGFQIFVQKEIEAIYKMANKDVLLIVGRTGNGKSSSFRSIRSVLKDETTAPGTSTTAPGPSTILPGLDFATYTEDNLELIDGTGIGDNGEDMIVNAEDLVKSISRKLTNGFTALVFVVKYGVRFTKQEVDAVETVKSIFGNDVFKQWGIILMTYGDNFYLDHDDDPNSFKAWCQDQNGDFKNLFDECNKRCVLFNNKTSESSVLESQHKMLMKQVEAVRKLSSGLYTSAHLKSAERSRNYWARKNKGKVTYNTFN
ncbi:uncharacterized protein LOC131938178 [Physella acuta]|uniref:uncharacterized protein LOC131938178 n=1 Tax=Physella acuta TaxID=109671 RepID=UPI0027DC5E10|nr:uncharacterized protein LOC131938178 [Physella acuta]